MEIKKDYVKNLKARKSKHKFPWQEKAEEITNYFGQSCYWLFHKFPEHVIIKAFQLTKEDEAFWTEQDIPKFKYFMGQIYKHK